MQQRAEYAAASYVTGVTVSAEGRIELVRYKNNAVLLSFADYIERCASEVLPSDVYQLFNAQAGLKSQCYHIAVLVDAAVFHNRANIAKKYDVGMLLRHSPLKYHRGAGGYWQS